MWTAWLIHTKIRKMFSKEIDHRQTNCLQFIVPYAHLHMKILVAFDFDHTIIDENSDLYVRKLAPGGTIPSEISQLYSNRGWTEYMGAIFQYLHDNNTTSKDIHDCMLEIPLVQGMKELFDFMNSDQFDVIIISDSNSVFIDDILSASDLSDIVQSVYTNPARFSQADCLELVYYHTQDWCELSTVNLCKGHILDSHIKLQAEQGVVYDVVAYVGDGTNDLCPALRLKSKTDLILPRIGYSLMEKLEDPHLDIRGTIIPWTTGQDIIMALKQSMSAADDKPHPDTTLS